MSAQRSFGASLRDASYAALSAFRTNENTFLIILAVVVGVLAGLGAVGFRMMINLAQQVTLGMEGHNILSTVNGLPWWYLLCLPAAGGLIVGPLVYFGAREAKGHGVPEVMEAVALKGGRIRPRLVLVKSLASAITMATGGSVGREGPIVHVGSAIGSAVAQWLHLPQDRIRVLVGCGAAAGIAATFNAPVAGVLFAIELIMGNYAITTLTPLIIASVSATIVCYAFPSITGGNIRAFEIPFEYELVSAWEVPLYGVLGVVGAVVAVAFVTLLYKTEDIFDAVKIPDYVKPIIGGFMLGGIYLAMVELVGHAHCFSIGYQSIEMAMRGELTWTILLALVGFKLLATSLTLGSGGSGGIFAPSLFIGAMFGGAFGALVGELFPGITGPVGAYALVGMAAIVAGTTHAPIMAIIMLFELTGDYQIILPLMVSCVLSSLLASRLYKDSIYTLKLSRRGVNLAKGFEATIMETTPVEDVMHLEAPTVRETTDFSTVLQSLLREHVMQIYVVDEGGKLLGITRLVDVKAILNESGLEEVVVAADLMNTSFPTITPESPIADCMRHFGSSYYEELPVLDEEGRPLGTVTRRDVLQLYHHEVLRQGALGLKYIRRQGEARRSDYVEMPEGHEVCALRVSGAMAGKSLRELDLRNRFKVNVVAIRSRRGEDDGEGDSDVPDPTHVLRKRDTLIVTARPENIGAVCKELGATKRDEE